MVHTELIFCRLSQKYVITFQLPYLNFFLTGKQVLEGTSPLTTKTGFPVEKNQTKRVQWDTVVIVLVREGSVHTSLVETQGVLLVHNNSTESPVRHQPKVGNLSTRTPLNSPTKHFCLFSTPVVPLHSRNEFCECFDDERDQISSV